MSPAAASPPTAEVAVDPNGSPVWGLVRVLATEDPSLRATLIDIEDDQADAESVYRELSSKRSEEVAYRGGERLIQRLPAPALCPNKKPSRSRPVPAKTTCSPAIVPALWKPYSGPCRRPDLYIPTKFAFEPRPPA